MSLFLLVDRICGFEVVVFGESRVGILVVDLRKKLGCVERRLEFGCLWMSGKFKRQDCRSADDERKEWNSTSW